MKTYISDINVGYYCTLIKLILYFYLGPSRLFILKNRISRFILMRDSSFLKNSIT